LGGKKSFIHRAQQDWTDAHDWQAKNRLSSILRDVYNIRCVFDRTIFINKITLEWTDIQPPGYHSKSEILKDWHIFMPDVLIKGIHPVIIELDGDWHFNSSKGIKQTNKRNGIYDFMDIRFVWFYTPHFMKKSTMEIVQELSSKL